MSSLSVLSVVVCAMCRGCPVCPDDHEFMINMSDSLTRGCKSDDVMKKNIFLTIEIFHPCAVRPSESQTQRWEVDSSGGGQQTRLQQQTTTAPTGSPYSSSSTSFLLLVVGEDGLHFCSLCLHPRPHHRRLSHFLRHIPRRARQRTDDQWTIQMLSMDENEVFNCVITNHTNSIQMQLPTSCDDSILKYKLFLEIWKSINCVPSESKSKWGQLDRNCERPPVQFQSKKSYKLLQFLSDVDKLYDNTFNDFLSFFR